MDSLPYGHAYRLLNNRKPETMLFSRRSLDVAIARSICCHNHLEEKDGDATWNTVHNHYDPETGLYFKYLEKISAINLMPSVGEVDKHLMEHIGSEFLCVATHEQYSYPDYYAYQSDHFAKIHRACQLLHENGYTFIYADELVKN